MTLRGLLVCFVELFLIILALGTEIEEFFVVAICVAGLMAFSLLSLVLASLTLQASSKIDKKAAIRGDKIEYTLVLYGVALIPIAAYLSLKTTELEFNYRSRKRHSFIILPSFSLQHEFTFQVPSVHVGMWDIGIKKMRFEDVFGLFAFPLVKVGKREFTVDLAVMPQIHHIVEESADLNSGGFGNSGFKNAEEGDLLGDSRPYKIGDSLKRINWKLSARAKTIYSRQYEVPQRPKVVIVADNAVFGETVSDVSDIITETAISLGDYFLSRNNMVDIIVTRIKKSTEDKKYLLRGYADIHKTQYDFTQLNFYKGKDELTLNLLENPQILKADRVYLVSTNPSQQLLSDFTDLVKNGKIAKCFIPKTAYNGDKVEDFREVAAVIPSVEKIAETVGAAI